MIIHLYLILLQKFWSNYTAVDPWRAPTDHLTVGNLDAMVSISHQQIPPTTDENRICSWESAAGKPWLVNCPSGKRKYCSPSWLFWVYGIVNPPIPRAGGIEKKSTCKWAPQFKPMLLDGDLSVHQRNRIRCVLLRVTVAEAVLCAHLFPLTPGRPAEAPLPAFPACRWAQGSERWSMGCRWKQYPLSGPAPNPSCDPTLPPLVFQMDEENEGWTQRW